MIYFFFYKLKFLLLFIIIFHPGIIYAESIFIKSIIKLDKKIPKECGIKISINDLSIIKVSIKKKKTPNITTIINLEAETKKNRIQSVNLITSSVNLINEIKAKPQIKDRKFNIEGNYDENNISIFFKELLISGGELFFNDFSYKIPGPIDSKVRLEYLFCTGEMFHPKYKE